MNKLMFILLLLTANVFGGSNPSPADYLRCRNALLPQDKPFDSAFLVRVPSNEGSFLVVTDKTVLKRSFHFSPASGSEPLPRDTEVSPFAGATGRAELLQRSLVYKIDPIYTSTQKPIFVQAARTIVNTSPQENNWGYVVKQNGINVDNALPFGDNAALTDESRTTVVNDLARIINGGHTEQFSSDAKDICSNIPELQTTIAIQSSSFKVKSEGLIPSFLNSIGM